MADYIKAGGAWINDNSSIGVTLSNGIKMTLWPNTFKKPGERSPDYRITMRAEDADSLGIEERTEQKQPTVSSDDININDLPF